MHGGLLRERPVPGAGATPHAGFADAGADDVAGHASAAEGALGDVEEGCFALDGDGGSGTIREGAQKESLCCAHLRAVVGAGFGEGAEVGGVDLYNIVTETKNFLVGSL